MSKSQAALALASALRVTFDLREKAYDRATGSYLITYREAAEQAMVSSDLVEPVVCLLTSGYCEVQSWMEEMLDGPRHKAA